MKSPHRVLGSIACLATVLALTSCNNDKMEESTAVGDSTMAPGDATAGPATDQYLDKKERFRRAIAGLSFDSGVVEITTTRRYNPRSATRHFNEGTELYDTNHVIDATREFRIAIQYAPQRAESYFGLGNAVHGRGETGIAIAAFRTAVQLDPEFTDARFNLAMALQMDLRLGEAIDEMNQLVEIDPENGAAHERLAIWNRFAGDHAQAWDHVHAAEALGHEMPGQFIALLAQDMPDPG